MLGNIKTVKANRAFTIVELLIVIVVIAILAAISIVAYNGIQSRSRLSAAQSTANIVAKKSESWNAIQGSYPSYCQLATNTLAPTGTATGIGATGCTAAGGAGPAEAKLDDPTLMAVNAASVTATTGVNTVFYQPCGTTGARLNYFHYTNNAITTNATNPTSPTIGTGC